MKKITHIILFNIIFIFIIIIFTEFFLFTKEYFRLLNEDNLRQISKNEDKINFDYGNYYQELKYHFNRITKEPEITKETFRYNQEFNNKPKLPPPNCFVGLFVYHGNRFKR